MVLHTVTLSSTGYTQMFGLTKEDNFTQLPKIIPTLYFRNTRTFYGKSKLIKNKALNASHPLLKSLEKYGGGGGRKKRQQQFIQDTNNNPGLQNSA